MTRLPRFSNETFFSIQNSSAAHLFGLEARQRFFKQYKAMTLVHHHVVDALVRARLRYGASNGVMSCHVTLLCRVAEPQWASAGACICKAETWSPLGVR